MTENPKKWPLVVIRIRKVLKQGNNSGDYKGLVVLTWWSCRGVPLFFTEESISGTGKIEN